MGMPVHKRHTTLIWFVDSATRCSGCPSVPELGMKTLLHILVVKDAINVGMQACSGQVSTNRMHIS